MKTSLKPLLKLNTKGTFKLTKTGSKRDNSTVYIGESLKGSLTIHKLKKEKQDIVLVEIQGRGFDFMRTSPVVKITDQTSDSILFETEGGFYKLETLSET
jgi:hypothetical protein